MSVSAIVNKGTPVACNGCGRKAIYGVGESDWCGDCAVKSIQALAAIVTINEPERKKAIMAFFAPPKRRR